VSRRVTRRQALAEGLAGAAALGLAGCGGSDGLMSPSGSTLQSTWVDPLGIGVLRVGPGEPMLARTDLGPPAPATRVIATLAHLTDAHVLDASSPARATFLNRLGPPFQSTFRPHETLTVQVFAGALAAVRALAPDAVIQGGDLIDNDQANELGQALAAIRGGIVRPGSGPWGYYGVQLASNADPFYYRPDLDAPRHPGLLRRASKPFRSPGVASRVYPVLGDHDILVAGELRTTEQTQALALGDEAVWELPPGLVDPTGLQSVTTSGAGLSVTGSPDGPLRPELVSRFLNQALDAPKVKVPADTGRRQLPPDEAVQRLAAAAGGPVAADRELRAGAKLDYVVDLKPQLRLIVLDLARRGGGSGGLVRPEQPAWLERQLADALGRWVIVVSHQPLSGSAGGEPLLELLDRDPHVIAVLSGHTHRNLIEPRPSPGGGYWVISTASLIDFPQQTRALRVVATRGGGVALQTWMLDHVLPVDLGHVSRQLSYLYAQGGRPGRFAGGRLDRNVALYRR
jgi:3',5'-cyclic AMP phosphodiesterase CpdA